MDPEASTKGRRRRRFEDPAAEMVWCAIEQLDDAGRRLVLDRLREDLLVDCFLDDGPRSRGARAVTALREAAAILGRSPSVREYQGLLEADPACDWPAEGKVRRWIGDGRWNVALERAGLEAEPSSDVIVRDKVGSAFGEDELTSVLRACAADLHEPPTFLAYYVWVDSESARLFPGRRARSIRPFVRMFGSWGQALAAAGVIEGTGARFRPGLGVMPATRAYSRKDVIRALQDVAAFIGHPPTPAEYSRARVLMLQQAIDAGHPVAIPAEPRVRRSFPNWTDGLIEAGLVRRDSSRG